MIKKTKLSKFSNDIKGNIAISAAIVMPVTMLMVGGAIDYSIMYTNQMNLERAADSAVAASVSEIRKNIDDINLDEIEAVMENTAKKIFNAEKKIIGKNLTVDFKVTAKYEDQVLIASIDYEYHQPTTFLKLAGMEKVSATGTAQAKSSLGSHTDFNIMVNVSNSMGVGASQDDIDYMLANYKYQGKSCAFACHNTINEVRKLPVTIRLDAATNAIEKAIDSVKYDKHPDSVIRFGLYTYATYLTEVFNVDDVNSENTTWVSDMVSQNVQLSKEDNSRMDNAANELAKYIDESGDGLSSKESKKYVLIITDGVQWIRPRYPEYDKSVIGAANRWWARAQIPNPKACDDLKKKGVEVYFIYTTYIPIYNGTGTDSIGREIDANILPVNQDSMKACASSEENFFEAKDEKALNASIEKIFKDVVIPTHISM